MPRRFRDKLTRIQEESDTRAEISLHVEEQAQQAAVRSERIAQQSRVLERSNNIAAIIAKSLGVTEEGNGNAGSYPT